MREALRGPREVLELWATERALAAEPWLARGESRASRSKPERELTEARRDARPPGRRRVGASRTATPTPTSSPAAERRCSPCLDQVTDPHNLGAVCRSAEGAGATGVVVPAHGSARVTPAVCRASAGAVEHLPIAVVTNLARYLDGGEGRRPLGLRRRRRRATTPMWEADLSGGVALVFGAEGKGLRPLVRRTLRRRGLDPARRAGRVAERERRRGAAALRGAPAARAMAEPTPLPLRRLQPPARRARSARPRARRRARELRRDAGRARRRSSSTASATTTSVGPLGCATRRTPTRCSSGSPPSTAAASGSCSSRPTPPCAAPPGVRSRKLSSQTFLRDLAPAEHRRAPPGGLARQARRRDAGPARAPAPRRAVRRTRRHAGPVQVDL